VTGEQWNMLITYFRIWKVSHYVPHAVHKAIRWNSRDLLSEPEIIDVRWRIIEKQKKKALDATTNTESFIRSSANSTMVSLKRKISDVTVNEKILVKDLPVYKRPRNNENLHNAEGNEIYQISVPLGIIWSNNSCVYDSVFSILYAVWKTNP
ncbi:hypothetical protein L208DRAFT_1217100, partial [Tricholoma matsutake]